MSINSRIKTIRIAKGLTLQQLSERTGVTKGYLSKVENSTSPPPVSTLVNLCDALHVDIQEFFDEDNSKKMVTGNLDLLRKKEQNNVNSDNPLGGYSYYPLVQSLKGKNMDPFIMEIKEGTNSSFFKHDSEEFIYVLKGDLIFEYEDVVYHLGEGDAFYFDSRLKHKFKAEKNNVKLLSINYDYRTF